MSGNYIPLHMHYAKGSVGDSILKTSDAVKKAKAMNLPAISITDHGSLANVIEFYRECKKENIKPIIGMEAYEVDDRFKKDKGYYHLVLLAKNKQGYEDLLHIAEDSQFNGFYYRPRTDLSVLKERGKNIIALSACLGGRIPKKIKQLSYLGSITHEQYKSEEIEKLEVELVNTELSLKKKAKKLNEEERDEIDEKITILKSNIQNLQEIDSEELLDNDFNSKYFEIIDDINFFKECFADFYLELQPGNFEEQITLNNLIIELAKETNTKLIVTNDVHYLNAKDYIAHDQHVKMAKKKQHDDPMIYPDKVYYMMDEADLRSKMTYIDEDILTEAINNTVRVADSIDLGELFDGKIKMPRPDIPKEYTEDDYLYKITLERLNSISYRLKDPSIYYDRLVYELETLKVVGFSGYLLIIKDIYDYGRREKIPMGPGRGSIAGSLVAYLIGITKVDPIKYNLLFERFISIHRIGSTPDIDIDVASAYRHLLFEYVINKYGAECCALVSTFAIRKAKGAIKDTARIFGIDVDFANKTSKLIPQVYYNDEDGEKQTDLSIEEALKISPELRAIQAEHEEWFEAAIKLENIARNTSIHAAGTLISPEPIKNIVPLIRNKDENGMMATALALNDAEYCGMIKYDFLSLATLDVIDATENEIGYNIDFDDDYILSDDNVWDVIGSKDTTTLFQIASDTYKKRMYRLKPRSIEQLAACLALVRGPCIAAKLDEVYMEIVEGKREIELIHPFYDSVTASTNGILLYQEQLMEVLVNFGMTLERAFQVMKYAAKKKEEELIAAEAEYRELATKNNVPLEAANRIWDIIKLMGLYSFKQKSEVY